MPGKLSKSITSIETPENESDRLASIKKYRILDTEDEKDFDDIVLLASQICQTPIAIITIIDAGRQWFKAKTGWHYKETARDLSFCNYTIRQDEIMVIPDATKDKRFANNPLVTDDPYIRFYAGVPLIDPCGHKLGTLAVIDRLEKILTHQQLSSLRILARQVSTLLDLRLQKINLQETSSKNSFLANLLEHTEDVIYSTDKKGLITSWNAAAEKMFGITRHDAMGKFGTDITGDYMPADERAIIRDEIKTKGTWKAERKIVSQNGHLYFVQYTVNSIINSNSEMEGYVVVLKNITTKKNLEAELQKKNQDLKRQVEEQTAEIRNVFERVSDGFVAIDKNGYCIYANRRAEQIVDCERGYLVGKYIWGEFHESVRNAFTDVIELAMKSQEHQSMEVYYPIYDRWFENQIYPSPTGLSIYFRDITKRKIAEHQLKESEERYRQIVETAQEGIWEIDENGYTTFVNGHLAQMLGYERDEMLGKHLFTFMDASNQEAAKAHLARRKLGINEQHDFVFQTKSGQFIITSLKTNSIIKDGIYKGALAMVMDVTQRRRAEEKLVLSEKRFRALIENSSDGLTVMDTNGIVLDMSPTSKKILGYNPNEIIGKNRPDLIYEGDREKVLNAFAKCLDNPKYKETIEYRHIMPDGSLKWLECSFTNLLAEPAVNSIVLNYREITERKKADEALLKVNDRFKLIARATNDIVWDWDLIRDTVWWSENYFSLLGYDKTKYQPDVHSWYDGIHPDDKDRVINGIHKAIKEGQDYWADEYRFKKADGKYLDIYDRAYTLYDKDGNSYRMIGAMMDISKRKFAEDKLKAQFDELQKKNYELDRFVYSVSHDLRAPLSSVLGLIHIAEMEDLNADVKKYLNLMCTSINRLDDFIREILDYARNARTELEFEKIDFNQLLQAAQNKVSLLAGVNRLHVNVLIEGHEYFYSDCSRLGILFNNILTNAVLYQDITKAESYVNISISISAEKVLIRVRDNGIGIEKKFVEKVFNMFYKASAISTGSGLGLYIVKEIVTRLGGAIAVTSEHGVFTEFEIVLPNAKPA